MFPVLSSVMSLQVGKFIYFQTVNKSYSYTDSLDMSDAFDTFYNSIIDSFAKGFKHFSSGYGIHHKRFHDHLHLTSSELSARDETHSEIYLVKGVTDMDDDVYIDSGLHSYITYLIKIVGQMLIINLLLPLTEDNKIKK